MGSASSTRKQQVVEAKEKILLTSFQIKDIVEEKYPNVKDRVAFYKYMIQLAEKEEGINQPPEVYDAEVLEFFKQVFPDGDHNKILKFFAHGLLKGYNDQVLFLCGPVSGKTTVIDLIRKAIAKEVGTEKCPIASTFSFPDDNYPEQYCVGRTFCTCTFTTSAELNLKQIEHFTNPWISYPYGNIMVKTHNHSTFVVEASFPENIPNDHPNVWKYEMKNRFKEFKKVVKPGWVDATLRLLKKYNEK